MAVPPHLVDTANWKEILPRLAKHVGLRKGGIEQQLKVIIKIKSVMVDPN